MDAEFTTNKDEKFAEKVSVAVAGDQIITLVTYIMTDNGEKCVKDILSSILEKYNRMDLFDIAYSSAKELIINATKANLKRVIFEELNLNIGNEADYRKGMATFKANLTEEKIHTYEETFKKRQMPVTATFYYSPYVMNIKVKNNYTLLPFEELRIRQKFAKAVSFSNLLEFYMEYGDETEGTGMGITMVGIILDQSGIGKHEFTLYSSEKYNETCAKLEIPLKKDYVSKRAKFDEEMKTRGISAAELRKDFRYTYRDFPKNMDK